MGYLAGVALGLIFLALAAGGACVYFNVDPMAVVQTMQAAL